jgi:ketosteroid isomerase-like protein
MIKRYGTFLLLMTGLTLMNACRENKHEPAGEITVMTNKPAEQKKIEALLDSFNVAAARADYQTYFAFYSDSAVFTGTDATERWNKQEYMKWAKPYFDNKRTWDFKSIDRHIYFDKSGQTAWFDELLNTQMKICRGSGVLTMDNGQWKIEQYILSMTVPNSQVEQAIQIKTIEEDSLIKAITPAP